MKVVSRALSRYFAAGLSAALLIAPPAAAIEQAPAPGSTPSVKQVEGVGDARWSDSLGFVGPGAEPAGTAPGSPVLDVPASAGKQREREPKRGQAHTDVTSHFGFATVAMRPINYGVEDSYIDFRTYGLLTDVGFLFPTSKNTMIPFELGMLWTFGGADLTPDPNNPDFKLELKAHELLFTPRIGFDVRVVDAPSWDLRLGPRVAAGVALATASLAPVAESGDMEAEFRWEVGAQAAFTFDSFSLEPRWRMVHNPAQQVHYLGADATWMTSKSFGLFARYEARVAASGGFRYRIGTGDGDVDSFALAHLRSMANQNTIAMGIVF